MVGVDAIVPRPHRRPSSTGRCRSPTNYLVGGGTAPAHFRGSRRNGTPDVEARGERSGSFTDPTAANPFHAKLTVIEDRDHATVGEGTMTEIAILKSIPTKSRIGSSRSV
jgi:hypothetical protein